ncbi:MAG TPA: pyridoxamine 5'-phosphate oxidase [Gammaproteobacteria bacterium]|nr:pyridoxamine 5'-phosphate oxidase [Gammaproteobacteria bacterium]
MDLDSMRREYQGVALTPESLEVSPFDQFRKWLQVAIDANMQDPTAMCLATVDDQGRPSQRIVLLKQFDETGLVFFTNLGSRKAHEILTNQVVSTHFAWLPLNRQVSVEGRAFKLGLTSVLKYFSGRPRESQLAAWASHQSQPISSRTVFENEFHRLKEKFSNGIIPLPSFWGGFRIAPSSWEFWQGGDHRLHDRFRYVSADDNEWVVNRLSP